MPKITQTICVGTEIKGDKIRKKASFKFGTQNELWFEFPLSVQNDLTDRLDPFVQALIFPMMEQGGVFEFKGNVSKSVIDNMTMFSRIWNIWLPEKYHLIQIIAKEIDDDYRPHNKKMITAFSGGLDASYTLYKYKKNLDSRFFYDVDKAIMIHGADIPLEDKNQFDISFKNAEKMTRDLCVELIPVSTNYREGCSWWGYTFGSVISATLSFFSKTYFYGAASDDSVHVFEYPWGMNPITDRYLSNDTFRFIADGYEHSRTERANFVKDWQKCLENLRVCWRNQDKSKNCGVCEKCVRTKLNFKAVGVSHLPSMPQDFQFTDLDNNNLIEDAENILFFEEILKYAQKYYTLSNQEIQILTDSIQKWQKELKKKTDKRTAKYYKYKILSKITVGQMRKKYKKKLEKYK